MRRTAGLVLLLCVTLVRPSMPMQAAQNPPEQRALEENGGSTNAPSTTDSAPPEGIDPGDQAESGPGTQGVLSSLGTAGFSSSFNGSAPGWEPHTGSWWIDSGSWYTTDGLPDALASASYVANYTNFDYQARVWRRGCGSCGHGIMVRGVPEPFGSAHRWDRGYAFYITRDGDYTVFKYENGAYTILKAWTYTPAIVQGDAWNDLRVVARWANLQFYINGTSVWSGSDSSFPSGRVGLLMFRGSASTADQLWVDWAELTSNPPWVACSTPNLTIPDSDPAGVFADIMLFSPSDLIADLDISVDVSHTWVGDLVLTVEKVGSGKSVTIIDRPGVTPSGVGCSGNGIVATLDDEAATPVENECAASVPTISGSFIPNNPLSAFDVSYVGGPWRLTVSDHAGGDVGTLNEWCLLFSSTFHTYLPIVMR